jgi:hypothetical protein
MIVAQEIIDYIISQVSAEMSANTGQIISGAGIAVKDIAGQVVTLQVDYKGFRNYVGLDDSKTGYFYIRLNGQFSEPRKAANVKRGSCGIESEVRIPLKLVFQHRCADPRVLLDAVKAALFNISFSGVKWNYNIVSPKLYPLTSELLPWVVYQSETGKDPKTLNNLMQIVSVDFELRFDYTYTEKCKPFSFC